MRKLLPIAAGLIGVLLLAAGALYVYGATRADVIAQGVTVNGISVGGLKANEARLMLRRTLVEPLERPVVVRHKDRGFKLTAARARIQVDVDASVDRALDASHSGTFVTRAWRSATGARVERDVPVEISYSKKAVRRLVGRVSKTLARAPVDAEVEISAAGISRVKSRQGRRVRADRLRRQLTRTLLATDGRRRLRAPVAAVKPDVTDKELVAKYPAILIVNRSAFTLTLYQDLKPAKTYPIAVGQAGMDTPAGLYTIQNKAENPAWHVPTSDWAGDLAGQVIPPDDPRNPIEARWMGIYDGAGIHGTTAEGSIGTAASHGCIRMRIPDVVDLYDRVPVDSPVHIS